MSSLTKMKPTIAAILALNYGIVQGEECFANQKFPKLFAPDDDSYATWTYSVTATDALNAIFTGGHSTEDGGKAWIMSVNLDHNRVQWRRYYEASSEMDTITAMALRDDGKSMAVVGTKGSHGVEKFIFTIRTSDGGHETQINRFMLGNPGVGEH